MFELYRRVQTAQLLSILHRDTNRPDDLITGDEKWVIYREPASFHDKSNISNLCYFFYFLPFFEVSCKILRVGGFLIFYFPNAATKLRKNAVLRCFEKFRGLKSAGDRAGKRMVLPCKTPIAWTERRNGARWIFLTPRNFLQLRSQLHDCTSVW